MKNIIPNSVYFMVFLQWEIGIKHIFRPRQLVQAKNQYAKLPSFQERFSKKLLPDLNFTASELPHLVIEVLMS